MEFPSPENAGDASILATYLTIHLLTMPREDIVSYQPPDAALEIWPNPDPAQYQIRNNSNEGFHIYLDYVDKSIDELSWGERYLLSRGYVPEMFSVTGRVVLQELFIELLEATAEEKRKDTGLRVVSGICVGRIVELNGIPGSLSRQKLAYVDVGVLTGEDGKPFLDIDGNKLRDIRQIVCGGTDVLLPGHQVLVALPGARLSDGKKVRSRHLNIRNEKGEIIRYNTDGVLLSHEEASLVFKDFRDYLKDQVLILPKFPKKPEWFYKGEDELWPGRPMDNLCLIVRSKTGSLRDFFFPPSLAEHSYATTAFVSLSLEKKRELEKTIESACSDLSPEALEALEKWWKLLGQD